MTPNARKTIAREWLYFVTVIFFDATILPAPLGLFFNGGQPVSTFYREMYSAFFDFGRYSYAWISWSIVLVPYILLQITRSLIWAAKTLKH